MSLKLQRPSPQKQITSSQRRNRLEPPANPRMLYPAEEGKSHGKPNKSKKSTNAPKVSAMNDRPIWEQTSVAMKLNSK